MTIDNLNNPTLTAYERGINQGIYCPKCGTDITDSKGSQPLPDMTPAETTHGWACKPCNRVFPSRAGGPEAPSFISEIVGVVACVETFDSDTEKRWIPVSEHQLHTEDRTLTDAPDPAYTFHIEPREVGGRVYSRCEDCGSETVGGPLNMIHEGGCSIAARQKQGFSPEPKSVSKAQVYSGVTATLSPDI